MTFMMPDICVQCGLPRQVRCGRCKTPYCSRDCQKKHWVAHLGHKKQCPVVQDVGLERHYAETRARGAAADAEGDTRVRAPPDAMTCYLCFGGGEETGGEALVRDCGCAGPHGYAHLACLARSARVFGEGGDADNPDDLDRWARCGLCGKTHARHVLLALARECWKTYLDKPDGPHRLRAMRMLGDGCQATGKIAEARHVRELYLALYLKFAPDAPEVAVAKVRLAKSYRAETDYVRPEFKKSLPLDKGAYDAEHADAAAAATAAIHYCESLQGAHKYVEVQAALRPAVVAAAASLGEGHERTCVLKRMLAYMVATKGVKGDVANGAWHVPLPDLVVAREMLEAAIAEAVATLGDAHEEVKALRVMAEEFEERKRWYHQFETGSLLNPGPPFEGFIPKTSPTQGPRFDSGWTHAADEPPKDPAPIFGSHDDPFPADPWPAPAKMPPLAELEEQRITPTLSDEPVPLRNAPVRSRFGGLCLDGSVPFSGPPNPIRPPDGLRVLGEYTAEGRPMDAPPPPGRPTFGFGTNRPDDSMDLG